LKKTQDLIKDLKKLDIVDDLYVYKIADLLPISADDVKTIFAKARITLSENDIKKILEIVNKYYIE
jgi:DNA-directed RNA polymerase subunit F